MVGKRFDARQQSWQVQWRCHGPLSLRVRVNALNGDNAAAERVAQQLQEHILNASDRSDRTVFSAWLDELIAAELDRMSKERPRGLDAVPSAKSVKVARASRTEASSMAFALSPGFQSGEALGETLAYKTKC